MDRVETYLEGNMSPSPTSVLTDFGAEYDIERTETPKPVLFKKDQDNDMKALSIIGIALPIFCYFANYFLNPQSSFYSTMNMPKLFD